MSGMQLYHSQSDADSIEREIERYCVALGIDWTNPAECKALAAESLAFDKAQAAAWMGSGDRGLASKANLLALIQIMFKTMQGAADGGYRAHGGAAWKAIAKEIYALAPKS